MIPTRGVGSVPVPPVAGLGRVLCGVVEAAVPGSPPTPDAGRARGSARKPAAR